MSGFLPHVAAPRTKHWEEMREASLNDTARFLINASEGRVLGMEGRDIWTVEEIAGFAESYIPRPEARTQGVIYSAMRNSQSSSLIWGKCGSTKSTAFDGDRGPSAGQNSGRSNRCRRTRRSGARAAKVCTTMANKLSSNLGSVSRLASGRYSRGRSLRGASSHISGFSNFY
jgi:hypothetical protein